ncbi:uncharacterized protein [Littorina saxatilis]|uniref:uncharacterized protein n=1 Tax=Littorina saxatilis TaxID=31220 RepID=UPI0038B46AFE
MNFDQELIRGLGGDQHDLDGDCNSVFHHRQQSRPSSQPPSRPPSRAHPSVDNPSHREKSPSQPDNSCDRRQDDVGGCVPTTGRAPDTEDREAIRIPSHSIQTVSSAHHLLEYVHKQTVEATGKPDVSFELIVRMKNEGKGSGSPEEKTSPAADSTDSREAKIAPSKADHTPRSRQSSGDEWSRMARPPEGPTQALSQFWRFRPRTFPPGLMRPGCRGDYPWPPGPQFPRPLLAAPVDPYRFYVPRVPGGRPKFASAVSDSGREELREGAARQRYPNSTYDEWSDLPPFPTSSTYYGDPTSFYNLPPPPPPPPPPSE